MAYFDSPKNRALWNKELASLRKMKEDRQSGKVPAVTAEASEKPDMSMRNLRNMHRVRTSYKELLAEETSEIKARRSAGLTKAVEKNVQKTKSAQSMSL